MIATTQELFWKKNKIKTDNYFLRVDGTNSITILKC